MEKLVCSPSAPSELPTLKMPLFGLWLVSRLLMVSSARKLTTPLELTMPPLVSVLVPVPKVKVLGPGLRMLMVLPMLLVTVSPPLAKVLVP